MEHDIASGLSLYGRDGTRKYTTRTERHRVLATAFACENRKAGTLTLMLALTGCRISEALSLTPVQIDIEECFVSFRCLKKRGRLVVREVPVPRWFIDRLLQVHDLGDERARLWPYGRTWGWTLIKNIMHDSALSSGGQACPRGLRHGMGVHAILSGVPITFVKRWLGHARLSTTAIYLDAIGPEEREIASRMWSHPSEF
jgi:integrase